jgi:hypothetical protein
MKKLLGLGLLATFAVLATERPAQAWVNSKFSVGLNWQYQAGGNNLLWGLYRSGQVPGPWGDGLIPGLVPAPPSGHAPYAAPYGAPPPAVEAFPYYGGAPAPTGPAVAPAQPLPAVRTPGQQAWQHGTIPNWQAGQNVYQAVGYQPSYVAPTYNYPNYNYGGYDYSNYYSAPSYWYGR